MVFSELSTGLILGVGYHYSLPLSYRTIISESIMTIFFSACYHQENEFNDNQFKHNPFITTINVVRKSVSSLLHVGDFSIFYHYCSTNAISYRLL
jgi:hypothetical protein